MRLLRPLAWLVALLALPSITATVHAQAEADDPTARAAIESVLIPDSGRTAPRLPRVTYNNATAELTVVFAMRRPGQDDPRQIVASATDDAFTILWAVYGSDAAPRIRSTTVLGTYAVVGRYERAREIPLVRAVLSADRATTLDWSRAAVLDPLSVFDTWWVEGELQ
jgi:hypothetical protein